MECKDFNASIARFHVEEEYEFRKWAGKMPAFQFDPNWEVKIIPPFGGAVARFYVINGNKHISVYFDAYDELGCVGEPYWECYPNATNGDVARFLFGEEDALMQEIKKVLNG